MHVGDALRAGLAVLDAGMTYRKNWPEGPWQLESGGRVWAIATNAYALVAVPRELVAGDLRESPDSPAKLARKWIAAVPQGEPVTLAAGPLKRFVGVSLDQCRTCHGRRRV